MATRGRPRTFDRQQALESSIKVFRDRGYDGATLEDLLTAMGGIAPPSFYAAFESKEKLYREAVEWYAATFGSGGRDALAAPKARDGIEGMLRMSVDAFTDPARGGGCLVLLAGINCTRTNTRTTEFLRGMRQQPAALIRQRLQQGVDEGELSESVDLDAIASFYTTVLHGIALRSRDGAPRAALAAAVDGAMAAWKPLTTPPRPASRTPAPRKPASREAAPRKARARR